MLSQQIYSSNFKKDRSVNQSEGRSDRVEIAVNEQACKKKRKNRKEVASKTKLCMFALL